MCKWKYLNWQHYFVRIFTFCLFVEVRNVYTFIWADSLGADAVTHSTLVNPNHSESPVICSPTNKKSQIYSTNTYQIINKNM